jgi:hypothetical protein
MYVHYTRSYSAIRSTLPLPPPPTYISDSVCCVEFYASASCRLKGLYPCSAHCIKYCIAFLMHKYGLQRLELYVANISTVCERKYGTLFVEEFRYGGRKRLLVRKWSFVEVLWNLSDLLRFRFRLWRSFGSGSNAGKGPRPYLTQFSK